MLSFVSAHSAFMASSRFFRLLPKPKVIPFRNQTSINRRKADPGPLFRKPQHSASIHSDDSTSSQATTAHNFHPAQKQGQTLNPTGGKTSDPASQTLDSSLHDLYNDANHAQLFPLPTLPDSAIPTLISLLRLEFAVFPFEQIDLGNQILSEMASKEPEALSTMQRKCVSVIEGNIAILKRRKMNLEEMIRLGQEMMQMSKAEKDRITKIRPQACGDSKGALMTKEEMEEDRQIWCFAGQALLSKNNP